MSNTPYKFETLWGVFSQTKKNAESQGLTIEIEMVYGGMSYGENKTFNCVAHNPKAPRSTKMWHIVVTRMEDGTYELVDYYL